MKFVSATIEVGDTLSGRFSTTTSFDGERFTLDLTAHEPIKATYCSILFHHAFDLHTRVMVNGYQSWTRSEEHRVFERVHDLSHVPNRIVDRFALDAMGDYRFIEYDMHRGCFHGFTYATIRANRYENDITLIGSLDESRGFTLINIDARAGEIILQTECPNRVVDAGETLALCRYAVITGSPDDVFDRYFELLGITARPAQPLCGYTSWYRHYDAIDEGKLITDLASAKAILEQLDTEGLTSVFQIDDGWCKVGDWLHINEEKFPHGLAALAHAIAEQGLVPGLWMAPFVCERDSQLAKKHPDWLLRDSHRKPVTTGDHWSGGLALDTRNPEVREYVRTCIQTAVREWNFKLLKLDFLYTACMVPHDSLNRGELMADAVELVREAAGDDCLILGCGVPLASVFGHFEYCRIGCDVGPDWNDKLYMRPLHSERVSTKHSIANTKARAPLNGRAFLNDPDVCFIDSDIKLSESQRNTLLNAASEYAGMLLTSDDMSKWTSSDIAVYQKAIYAIAERCRS